MGQSVSSLELNQTNMALCIEHTRWLFRGFDLHSGGLGMSYVRAMAGLNITASVHPV